MAAALFPEKDVCVRDTEQPLAASPPPLAYSSRAWPCDVTCDAMWVVPCRRTAAPGRQDEQAHTDRDKSGKCMNRNDVMCDVMWCHVKGRQRPASKYTRIGDVNLFMNQNARRIIVNPYLQTHTRP